MNKDNKDNNDNLSLLGVALIAIVFMFTACVPAHASTSTDNAYESDPIAQSCIKSSKVIEDYFYAVRASGMTRSDVIAQVKGQDDERIPEYLTTLNAVNVSSAFFDSGDPKEAGANYMRSCLDMVNSHIREVK